MKEVQQEGVNEKRLGGEGRKQEQEGKVRQVGKESEKGQSVCGNVGKELLLVMKWRCCLEYVRRSITAAA